MEFKGTKGEIAKELHDYFRDKIVNGYYEIVKKDTHTWSVLIDGCYPFELWIANQDFAFRTYNGDESKPSFMIIEFRVKDKLKGWNKIKKEIQDHEETILKEERRKKYEKLKSEFE